VVSSLDDYHRWKAHGATVVGVILCDPVEWRSCDRDAWLDEVYQVAKTVQYLVLSREVIGWKSEDYWKENFDNLFQLEEIHELYPFVGAPWGGSVSDAIHMLALVCRYHRLVDVPVSVSVPVSVPVPVPVPVSEEQRPCYDMTVEQEIRPPEFVLFTQFFSSSAKKRNQELRECLRRNLKCRWVDRVVLLNERDESTAWASFLPKDTVKIEQHVIGRRLTYADFLQEVVRRYPHGSGLDAIVALANADIYFGEELAEAWRIQWEDRAVCLLRWDDEGNGPARARLFGPRADSQDTWMFSAASVAARRWPWKDVDIPLGKPGCDNAILYPLLQQRFLLSNPALSLKTYHLHNSGVRSYQKSDVVFSPVYIHLQPTYLIDTKQEFAPREAPQYICNEVVSFTVRSSSMSNEITYCTMLEKEGRYRWEPTVENYYFEPAIPVYRWREQQAQQPVVDKSKGISQKGGAGVTPNGLVYDLYRIYTGRAAIQQPEYNYWPSAGVDLFTPLRSCKRMAAIPLANAPVVFQHREAYFLYYLSRYLRIRSTLSSEEDLGFWMPHGGVEVSAWKGAEDWGAHGLLWEQGVGCWAEEVVGYLPGPSVAELGREDMMMLRECAHGWREAPFIEYGTGGRTCIVVGDELLTDEWVLALRAILPSSWRVERADLSASGARSKEEAWYGASLCLLVGGPNTVEKWAPLWRLPKGAVLLEFQQELAVAGESQHIAHVADLSSWIMLLSKGSDEAVREDILSSLKGWWAKHHSIFSSDKSSDKPSLSLPSDKPSLSLPSDKPSLSLPH
jgi:hypothetical protein